MDIEEIQVYRGPNIFSHNPVIRMKVRLGELADVPTREIGSLNEKVIGCFPGLADHKCSTGYTGGFLDRMKEGTYLAHLTEHLCLELQRVLGHDMKYGKARQIKDDLYSVVFACTNTVIGKACGVFVVNAINEFIKGNNFEFDKELSSLRDFCVRHEQGPSTKAIMDEAKKRGIPVSEVGDSGMLRLGFGKYQKYISATLYEQTSVIAADIACDKALTKTILEEAGIIIPQGRVCHEFKEAVSFVRENDYPVVIKPLDGNQGKQVYIGVSDDEELKDAFEGALSLGKEVLIEKQIEGNDYRILVVNGSVVAAAKRIPAYVVGDGKHTVSQLVDIKNMDALRGEDHEKPLTKIKLDSQTDKVLRKQGIALYSIPSDRKVVWLKQTANLSTGGEAHDCTDALHPVNREIAELAAKSVGLDIAGIDIVIPDISKPMSAGFGAVVEVNAAPGIRMHLYPASGVKRDVITPILDMIYPEGEPFTIPVISITGTNGKTTTTRMINHIMMRSGLNVGMTTTHGIYINGKCIEEGDTTGPRSARRILNDRRIEAAVLETARGGIVREGLAYEKSDVAVFTNLSEDHLGVDNINTMEELLHVKSLILETVKSDGACVINADDPWVIKTISKAKGRIILFSKEYGNPYILDNISKGGAAVYKEGDSIYFTCRGFTRRIIDINDIPATLDGALSHNVYNSMAAIGACSAVGVSFENIAEALKSFRCDAATNPGRFNVYQLGDIKVVLDYGHNTDGYRVTIDALKKLNPAKLTGIIGVPGDRRNEDIKKIGEISGMSFDHIIIKEDGDLRGRQPLEVAHLLLKGALESGMPEENIEVIPDEKEALESALDNAQRNEVIVVFFEKLEPLADVIQKHQENRSEIADEAELLLMA